MDNMRRLLIACFAGLFLSHALPAQDAEWKKAVDGGIGFLKNTQNEDGSWGGPRFQAGVTGIIVTGMMQSGEAKADDPTVAKAVKYIEGLVNAKEGHIAGKMPQLQNYITCVNVMALQAVKQPEKYKAVVGDAVKYLKQLQFDEAENKKEADDEFGGAGYDGKSRPDLSNTQFFLDALKDAGVPQDDPAFKKALVFVSRCQNLKTEFNDRPFAGKVNDGSFIYGIFDSKKGEPAGYGSMTYAGIKSMIYCGVSKDDPRMKAAIAWVSKNYDLEKHPGKGESGLYYYYHTMAKALAAAGIDEITTPDGKKHDWRKELTAVLAKKQKPDGSWTNESDRFMEGDPALVTGYALMALSYCKK